MPSLPRSGIELVAETQRYNRSINEVIASSGRVDSAMSDIVRAANRAEGALNDIDGNVDVRIDARLGDDSGINAITGLTDNINVNIDAPLGDRSGIRAVEGLPDNADVNIDVKEGDTAAIEAIQGQLEALQVLGVIQLALLLPANLADVSETLSNLPVIGQIIEMEDAIASVNARVANEIPNAGRIINNWYTQAWGDSRQELADLLVELDRLGVAEEELEDVGVAAFQAAAIGQTDVNEVLRAADQLVSNDLVPSYREAFDFIVRGYQEGLDQSGDFLDTLTEYSPVFADNGLDAQAFFEIMNAGLEAGAFNTDKLADSFKEMLNLTREEISIFDTLGDETDRTRALEELGLADEATAFAAGEITGTAFADGVISTIQGIEDPALQRQMALAIFSPTMVEDAALAALLAIDLAGSSENQELWQNAANEAGDIYFATIGTAFTELSRTIEVELTEAINNSLNLDDWLDEARSKVQTLADELQAGKTLGEALEIALEIPGFENTVQHLESVLGQFVIELSLGLASVLEAFGHSETATDIREFAADLAGQQFIFDVAIANDGEEITDAVQNAIRRGVRLTDVQAGVGQAVTELIAQGDFDRAQALIDSLSATRAGENTGREFVEAFAASVEGTVGESAIAELLGVENLREASSDAIVEYRDEINRIFSETNPFTGGSQINVFNEQADAYLATWRIVTGEVEILQAQIDNARDDLADMQAAAEQAAVVVNRMPAELAYQSTTGVVGERAMGETPSYVRMAPTVQEDMDAVEVAVQDAATAVILSSDELSGAVETADDVIHQAVIGGSIVPDIRLIASTALSAFPQVVAPAMLMGASVQLASSMVNNGLMMIRNTASVAMPQAAGFVNNLTQEIYGLGDTAPVLDSIISKLQQLASAGSNAREVLQSVAAAGNNVTNNVQNTSVTVNQTNNVQSSAQAASVGFANSRAIRGF